jgi:uncharacterized damage-inducible protein DinB
VKKIIIIMIDQTIQRTEAIIQTVAQQFQPQTEALINRKHGPDQWSILECLEHLNRYHRYYNKALREALAKLPESTSFKQYRSAWLGAYFIKSVAPDNQKKQKTMSHLNPSGSNLSGEVIDEFLALQKEFLNLIREAGKKDLNPKLIRVEVMKLIRMKIGDTLLFLVNHNERHIGQALRVLEIIKASSTQQVA